ncbi:MAG: hypothetical protein WD670_10465, partial [Actinomycetota bacterium]
MPVSCIIPAVDVRSIARGMALGAAALAVGAWTSSGLGRELDQDAFRAANQKAGRGADRFYRGVTELGSIWASVGAAAVLGAAGR